MLVNKEPMNGPPTLNEESEASHFGVLRVLHRNKHTDPKSCAYK